MHLPPREHPPSPPPFLLYPTGEATNLDKSAEVETGGIPDCGRRRKGLALKTAHKSVEARGEEGEKIEPRGRREDSVKKPSSWGES